MTSSREDYLKAIAELQRSRERVGNRHIADYLGVSAASVSEIIRKMEKEGLVESMERRSIRLTRKGFLLSNTVIAELLYPASGTAG